MFLCCIFLQKSFPLIESMLAFYVKVFVTFLQILFVIFQKRIHRKKIQKRHLSVHLSRAILTEDSHYFVLI